MGFLPITPISSSAMNTGLEIKLLSNFEVELPDRMVPNFLLQITGRTAKSVADLIASREAIFAALVKRVNKFPI